MGEEINNWFKQSEADLKSAKNCIKSEDFYLAVFARQQAVEKSLKALCLLKLKEVPKGHSIIYLAQKFNVLKNMLSGVRDLNPEYLITRYPDMVDIPSELYDNEIAIRHVKRGVEM